MGVMSWGKKVVGALTNKVTGAADWNMKSKEAREHQVRRDYDYARTERVEHTNKMVLLNNYYNGKCYSKQQITELAQKYGWGFTPPSIPWPFIQVESQIDNVVPQHQFKGRDNDLDSERAKIREQVVDFIYYINKINELNLDNERALNELGNAFWKVSWDPSVVCANGVRGDIVIGNPDPANIFPDPAAHDVEDCEFIIYAFRVHRRKARRIFGRVIDSIINDGDHADTEIYDGVKRSLDDETLQVLEYWYRDDEGDIACSIQVNNVEVRHVPKYWKATRNSGNKKYPIVKYCKIPVRKSFWDKGEIETVMDLCDAANREFFTALLNDMFTANDIIVYEKDALVSEPSSIPGSHWVTKPGMVNSVRRLGGISNNIGLQKMVEFIGELVEITNGNYVSSQGMEPTRVTTASGIAQLNERADARKVVKKAGRLEGFARLAELCDWTALEFYNQDRIILIRGKNEGEPDTTLTFNSEQERIVTQYSIMADPETGQEMEVPAEYYYPKVDVEITAGDGIQKSKAFTLAATQELANMPINPANIGIVMAIIDLLDLPNKDEIKSSIEQGLQPPPGAPAMGGAPQGDVQQVEELLRSLPPEIQEAIINLPPEQQAAFLSLPPDQMMATVEQLMSESAIMPQGGVMP